MPNNENAIGQRSIWSNLSPINNFSLFLNISAFLFIYESILTFSGGPSLLDSTHTSEPFNFTSILSLSIVVTAFTSHFLSTLVARIADIVRNILENISRKLGLPTSRYSESNNRHLVDGYVNLNQVKNKAIVSKEEKYIDLFLKHKEIQLANQKAILLEQHSISLCLAAYIINFLIAIRTGKSSIFSLSYEFTQTNFVLSAIIVTALYLMLTSNRFDWARLSDHLVFCPELHSEIISKEKPAYIRATERYRASHYE